MDTKIVVSISKFCVILLVVICISCEQSSAIRQLHGEELLRNEGLVLIQSLQRGPVPPSGPSGCTNIPGSRRGRRCPPLSSRNFAGHIAARSPPTFSTSSVAKLSVSVGHEQTRVIVDVGLRTQREKCKARKIVFGFPEVVSVYDMFKMDSGKLMIVINGCDFSRIQDKLKRKFGKADIWGMTPEETMQSTFIGFPNAVQPSPYNNMSIPLCSSIRPPMARSEFSLQYPYMAQYSMGCYSYPCQYAPSYNPYGLDSRTCHFPQNYGIRQEPGPA